MIQNVREVKLEDLKSGVRIYRDDPIEGLTVESVDTKENKVSYHDGSWDFLDRVVGKYFFYINQKQQIGGTHYNTENDPIKFAKDNYPPEQVEGFFRINVDKYMARYHKKNGIEDLKKAKHYLELLLELKENEQSN